jgi:hypothetical protein
MKQDILSAIDAYSSQWLNDESFIERRLLKIGALPIMRNIIPDEFRNNERIAKSHSYLSQKNSVFGILNEIRKKQRKGISQLHSIKVITHINTIGTIQHQIPNYHIDDYLNNEANYNRINERLFNIRSLHFSLDRDYIERSFFLSHKAYIIVVYFFIAKINSRLK